MASDNELVQLTLTTLFYTPESFLEVTLLVYRTTLLVSLIIITLITATFSRPKEKHNYNNSFLYSQIFGDPFTCCVTLS